MREMIVISTLLLALALAAVAAHAEVGTVDFDRAGENAAKAAKEGGEAIEKTGEQAAKGVGQAADEVGEMFKKVFGPGESGQGEKQEDK